MGVSLRVALFATIFYCEMAIKGFPLQSLTRIDLRPDSYRELDQPAGQAGLRLF